MTRHSTPTSAEYRRRARRRLLSRAVSSAVAAGFLCAVPASAAVGGLHALSPPSSLKIVGPGSVSKTSIHLSWVASRSHVSGYRIYVDGALRASVHSTSYQVGRLRCGTSYLLSVATYGAAGRVSVSGTATIGATTAACPVTTTCTTTISSGLASAIQRASAGATICLNSGSYGDLSLFKVGKTADVIVQPASGANVTIGALTLRMVDHLRLTGRGGSMSVGGLELDPVTGDPSWSHNLTFDHLTWTSASNVRARGSNQALLFDHDRFDNLGTGAWEGRITVFDSGQTQPVTPGTVTISNSHFAGGCSDGVQVLAYGVQIGPGNEFTNITQSACSGLNVHADPIQCGGADDTLITGNYFHDNGDGSGGILCGVDDGQTVTNNVFVKDPSGGAYPWSIFIGGGKNWVVTHNTFAGGGAIRFEVFDGYTPSGNLVRDNVFTTGGISADGSDYGTIRPQLQHENAVRHRRYHRQPHLPRRQEADQLCGLPPRAGVARKGIGIRRRRHGHTPPRLTSRAGSSIRPLASRRRSIVQS